jgi:hypothetical protein
MILKYHGIHSFQSLNNGIKNTHEYFYHIIEYISYLGDITAHEDYKDSKNIKIRSWVEISLISKFDK